MLADLQVYERDPITEPGSTRPNLRPKAALLGGVRVYGKL